MMETILGTLAVILALGIGAQWTAWRVGLPSILVLLIAGFAAGPLLGWVYPDRLLGELLMPLVSLSVGLILFEGGLTLKVQELHSIGREVRNLISLGALTTWVVATLAARVCFGWSWALATLQGAILTVTGPTVVIPLLRHIQPSRQVSSLLKWEAILIDPVGAVLALLVFEAVLPREATSVPLHTFLGFGMTLVVGFGLGSATAGLLAVAFKKYWVPDHLQNPVSLALVTGAFALSNLIQDESGLLTVTVMGIVLANQKQLRIRHIVEFKENLGVLLISCLFILLASRVRLEDVRSMSLSGGLGFLAILVFVARPLSVAVSCLGSGLSWKERLFLSWMAPRGIVAASVASVFAIRLAAEGEGRASELVPATFLIIVGTVALYGLTAGSLARWLGLADSNPQGVLFVGAHALARALAQSLKAEGFQVLLADTNWDNLSAARLEGLPTYYGNVLSEEARQELDLTGIGKLLAMTANQEVNTLAAMHLVEFFGRQEIYEVAVPSAGGRKTELEPHGRQLFGRDAFLPDLLERLRSGMVVRRTNLTTEFDFGQWQAAQGPGALPLFILGSGGSLKVCVADKPPTPARGEAIIGLVHASTPG